MPTAVPGNEDILGDKEDPSSVPLCPLQYLVLSFPTMLVTRPWDQGPRWVRPYYTGCLNARAAPALAQKGPKSKGGSRERARGMMREQVVLKQCPICP